MGELFLLVNKTRAHVRALANHNAFKLSYYHHSSADIV